LNTQHEDSTIGLVAIQCGYEIVFAPKAGLSCQRDNRRTGFLKRLLKWERWQA